MMRGHAGASTYLLIIRKYRRRGYRARAPVGVLNTLMPRIMDLIIRAPSAPALVPAGPMDIPGIFGFLPVILMSILPTFVAVPAKLVPVQVVVSKVICVNIHLLVSASNNGVINPCSSDGTAITDECGVVASKATRSRAASARTLYYIILQK
ncbi:hypothetical protein BJ138DRAFT_115929 [Hygrophoropsis aurantiaca]|uniref:Uncharacterized protein n=1 Tax=Hygrophoropsis aurantiaca TaxID=72124 RepID=A0ACB7ZSB7_9AGAM|nr:hypothetical protein BJ138DRAFT_115929 [Hygrophoropsis aurantiaca]